MKNSSMVRILKLMGTFCWAVCGVLYLCSCGKGGTEADSVTASKAETAIAAVDTAAVDSAVLAQQAEEAEQEQALAEMKAELETFVKNPANGSIPFGQGIKSLLNKIEKAEEETGYLIGPDVDFWTQSQDPTNPKWTLGDVTMTDSQNAKAVIKLKDGSVTAKFELTLSKTNGKWVIDDARVNGSSYKAELKRCLADA